MRLINFMKKSLRYLVPVPLKKFLKWNYYALQDLTDFVLRKSDQRYPPRRLNFVGSHDFKAVGDEFAEHFKALGGISPEDRVLDIGSGIGRMAIPLTDYLTTGQYEGFDIDSRGVGWCQQNITEKYSNFKFQYVDLYNKFYNVKGAIQPQGFKFPYADNSFDFVFATSVFTHLLPADSLHYLDEIARVTAPGGKVFLTWFVLDDESQKNMRTDASSAVFDYPYPGTNFCFYSHASNPEAEIAYSKKWLDSRLGSCEFYPGNWSGRAGTSYQDIVVYEPKKA